MENMKEKLEMAERKLQFDIDGKRRANFWKRRKELLEY